MKITGSNVRMESSHRETSYSMVEQVTIERRASDKASAAILELSSTGKSYRDSIEEYTRREEEELKKKQKENESKSLENLMKRLKETEKNNSFEAPDELDMKIKMMRKILANLQGRKLSREELKELEGNSKVADFRTGNFKFTTGSEINLSMSQALSFNSLEIGTNLTGTTWQRITATSGFHLESESSSFASEGLVTTADGRTLSFNVELTMSRAFMQEINLLESEEYIKTDPLIINIDSPITSVSDQKFYFDLDSDGKKEQISFAGQGSGFLALDKNGDGKINDGSELFGTKSGDGFKDLSLYDEDGNGWIDENDSVFSKLKVWTKDENGNDSLIDLLKADVGAIYLGNVDTQYSLKNDENHLNAEIRKTGIYLKESTGLAGTIAHVDLVV